MSLLVLHTHTEEGEEYLYYQYPRDDLTDTVLVEKLKGTLLGAQSVLRDVVGDELQLLYFRRGKPPLDRQFLASYGTRGCFCFILVLPVNWIPQSSAAGVALLAKYLCLLDLFFPDIESVILAHCRISPNSESIHNLLDPFSSRFLETVRYASLTKYIGHPYLTHLFPSSPYFHLSGPDRLYVERLLDNFRKKLVDPLNVFFHDSTNMNQHSFGVAITTQGVLLGHVGISSNIVGYISMLVDVYQGPATVHLEDQSDSQLKSSFVLYKLWLSTEKRIEVGCYADRNRNLQVIVLLDAPEEERQDTESRSLETVLRREIRNWIKSDAEPLFLMLESILLPEENPDRLTTDAPDDRFPSSYAESRQSVFDPSLTDFGLAFLVSDLFSSRIHAPVELLLAIQNRYTSSSSSQGHVLRDTFGYILQHLMRFTSLFAEMTLKTEEYLRLRLFTRGYHNIAPSSVSYRADFSAENSSESLSLGTRPASNPIFFEEYLRNSPYAHEDIRETRSSSGTSSMNRLVPVLDEVHHDVGLGDDGREDQDLHFFDLQKISVFDFDSGRSKKSKHHSQTLFSSASHFHVRVRLSLDSLSAPLCVWFSRRKYGERDYFFCFDGKLSTRDIDQRIDSCILLTS